MVIGPIERATEGGEDNGSDEKSGALHDSAPEAEKSMAKVRLSPAPPHGDTRDDDNERKQELAGGADQIHLRASHDDAAILRLFGADGNEVFVGGEPVHGVQGEIAIAVEIDEGVGGPGGTANDHEATLRIFLAGVVGARGGDGHRTFSVLGIGGVDFWRIQLVGGEAGVGGAEEFFDRRFRAALYVDGAGEREAGGGALHFADDGVGVVGGDQGHLWAEAGKLTYGIHVEDQILVNGDAPGLQHGGEGIVVGDFRAAHFQRRIEQEERAAAVFDKLLDGIDFRLLVIAAGAGGNQDGAIAGDFRFLQQVDGFGDVFILAKQFLEAGIAVAAGIVDLVLAAASEEAHGARGVFQVADKSTGDTFLGHAFGFLLVRAHADNSGTVVLDSGFTRELRILVGVHVLDMDLVGEVGVEVQLVAGGLKARGLIEVGDGGVLLEALDNLYSLVGEAVALVGSGVIGFFVATGQHIGGGDDSNHDREIGGGIGRIAGLTRFEKLGVHLRPPAQRFDGTRGQKESKENRRNVINRVFQT